MALRQLSGYEFTDFQHELEDLNQTHTNVIRREPGVTYHDEYALEELSQIKPMLYEQFVENWSRSYYSGSHHLKAILQYGEPNIPITNLNQRVYQQAVEAVRERLRSLPIVRAFSILTDLDQVSYESSSAAGYGYDGTKGPFGGTNHKRAIHRAKATLWSAIRSEDEGIEHVIRTAVPDIGYTRTQLTDIREKLKVRGVWGRAFHYILLEGLTAQPLLEAFKQGTTFLHIGTDPTVSVPIILSHIARDCEWIYALDWSSFDATASRFEIQAAFDLLKEVIQFPDFETEQSFEISRQLFIHKKIAAPDGKIYWSHKGIPSGSYFTSIIGSIINRTRVEYLWRLIKDTGPEICYTQGDDSISGDNDRISPYTMTDVIANTGWILNPEKTVVSRYTNQVTFLGRTSRGGLNERDLKRCLKLLILPEYPIPSGSISAYRATSISEDCGGTSQVLDEIARRLRRKYGIAPEDEVPRYLKIYRF
nr:RNA-dependent RNA polymerase [Carrot cryptic virus 2]